MHAAMFLPAPAIVGLHLSPSQRMSTPLGNYRQERDIGPLGVFGNGFDYL